METIKVNKNEVSISNPYQIINMGGPWVGNLLVNGSLIAQDVLIDNIIGDELENRVYFVKYHNVSQWKNENFFTIYYIDLITGIIHMIDLKFDMIFVENINKDELVYYEAFHSGDPSFRRKISLKEINVLIC